jgi:formylmethanofuran--tetrahydromethanopterin N-formyltransferase
MNINGVEIEDTFAEAFPMVAARAIITAETPRWAEIAAREATGYATSVIACDAEAGVERMLAPNETPDGRPGSSILCFAFNREKLEKAVANRVGQCVMTCATTACYDGLPGAEKRIKIGGNLRYFGDGFQSSKLIEEPVVSGPPNEGRGTVAVHKRRLWRVPVMDGEFVCEDRFGTVKGVAGGNFLILGQTQATVLKAAEQAMDAIRGVRDVIAPFPGGIVRSGSKVGSKYKALRASTNDAYCPTLRGITKSALPDSVNAVYEIVIDGLSLQAVEQATRLGVQAACQPGIVRISAGNYGGNLGPHHIRLRDVVARAGY